LLLREQATGYNVSYMYAALAKREGRCAHSCRLDRAVPRRGHNVARRLAAARPADEAPLAAVQGTKTTTPLHNAPIRASFVNDKVNSSNSRARSMRTSAQSRCEMPRPPSRARAPALPPLLRRRALRRGKAAGRSRAFRTLGRCRTASRRKSTRTSCRSFFTRAAPSVAPTACCGRRGTHAHGRTSVRTSVGACALTHARTKVAGRVLRVGA
jgi:hypothetical protein